MALSTEYNNFNNLQGFAILGIRLDKITKVEIRTQNFDSIFNFLYGTPATGNSTSPYTSPYPSLSPQIFSPLISPVTYIIGTGYGYNITSPFGTTSPFNGIGPTYSPGFQPIEELLILLFSINRILPLEFTIVSNNVSDRQSDLMEELTDLTLVCQSLTNSLITLKNNNYNMVNFLLQNTIQSSLTDLNNFLITLNQTVSDVVFLTNNFTFLDQKRIELEESNTIISNL